MGRQIYRLVDGGRVLDTRSGKVVAIDKQIGVAEHPFDDVENVGVWEWNAETENLLEACLTSQPANCTVTKLAAKIGKDVKTVRGWMNHPAFIRRLTLEQARQYRGISALRRTTVGQTLNKLAEKMDELLALGTNITQVQVKQLSNLLREFRNFRFLERTEFGEASAIVEAHTISNSATDESVLELISKHPREMAALANAILDQEHGVQARAVEPVDADFREEDDPPVAPPTTSLSQEPKPPATLAPPIQTAQPSVFDSLANLGLPLSKTNT